MNKTRWDVFVSHAGEDKARFVAPLAKLLNGLGCSVWYDEFSMRVGDSLSESIDRGLAHSRYGLVVLSPNFFKKRWPKRELRGLVTREMTARGAGSRILPIYYHITSKAVAKFSPPLADAFALDASKLTLRDIAFQILGVIRPDIAYHAKRVTLYNKLRAQTAHIKPEFADPSTLKPSPLPPVEISADLIVRAVIIFETLGRTFSRDLNDFIYDFQTELHPENEIEVWERIVAVHLQISREKQLNLAARKELLGILLSASAGAPVKSIPSKIFDRTVVKEIVTRFKVVLPRHFA